MSKLKRFAVWAICVLIFAYLPVWYTLVRAVLAGSYDVLFDLIKSGDVLLIACAVVADGIGRAWIRWEDEKTNPQTPRSSSSMLMLVSFAVAVGCVIIYAAAHSGPVLLVSMLRLTAAAAFVSAALSAIIVLVAEV